ncbi:hypothetical protein SuNHUV7_08420 (plasmid) [Pseudoseohaeicola sp. NH-UV-7]
MNVLIVESQHHLGALWQRHLERQGAIVSRATSQEDAIASLYSRDFDVIVLDLVLEQGSALAVSDFASYRRPKARVIFVTNTSFFFRRIDLCPQPERLRPCAKQHTTRRSGGNDRTLRRRAVITSRRAHAVRHNPEPD